MDAVTTTMTLRDLPVGARVIVRCSKDWRSAAVSTQREERVVLTVASPSGRTFRKSCPIDTPVVTEGFLLIVGEGGWRDGFVKYDERW